MFVASGIMPSESSMASSPALFAKMAEVNYVGVVGLLEKLLPSLAPGEGTFASCLTSVAGDRGRGSNFRYGSTKAALSTYLEGLSVSRSGQTLIQDVKLGPVDTPMNSGVRRAPFMISPDAAARAIWRGIHRGKPKLYVPAKWFWIMLAIRTIPAPIYRLLPL